MDADTLHKELQTKLNAIQSASDATLAPFLTSLMGIDKIKQQLSSLLQEEANKAKQAEKDAPPSQTSNSPLHSLSVAVQRVEDGMAQKKMASRRVDDDAKHSRDMDQIERGYSQMGFQSDSICYNCNGKGHFARECPMRQQGGQRRMGGQGGQRGMRRQQSVRCYHCGQDGHFARDCPEESNETLNEKCFRCGKTGHWARDCDQPRPNMGGGGGQGNDRCNRCGKTGHWARDCDLPYQGSQRSSDKCNRCGKEGHWARDCEQPRNDGYGGQDSYQEQY